MGNRSFRQLTPYETSLYFVPDEEFAAQRNAQIATIMAQESQKRAWLSKGYILIIAGPLSIVSLLIDEIQNATHFSFLTLSASKVSELLIVATSLFIILTLVVLMASINKGSRWGYWLLGGILLIAALIISRNYVFISNILFWLTISSLFLYPLYIGIELISAARNMQIEDNVEEQIPPPTDREFDAWLENKARELFSTIIRELNLDDKISHSRQLLRVRGYILTGMKESRYFRKQDLRSKRGADGRWRYSVNTYTYFYPDKHQIMVFTFHINAMNWDDYRKKTEEYFYQDIIGVTSIDDHDTLYVDETAYNYRTQRFSLKLSDGSAVSATVHSRPLDNDYLPTFDMPNSGIDTTVAQLRMLLREKKG